MRNRMNNAGYLVKTELVERAMKTIYLMQKFHCFGHSIQVAFTFAPLKQLRATTETFASFVLETAQISGFIERTDKPENSSTC